jgi:transcription initiation factor TFIIIB Brf1 subunit/transcription initiation factor TFIIB
VLKCPLCGSSEILHLDGEIVCASCGYVFPEAPADSPVVRKEDLLGSVPAYGFKFSERIAKHESVEFYARYGARVQQICEVLHLPEIVREEALVLEKKLLEKGYRFGDLEAFSLALVLVASRIHGFTVSYDALSRTFKVSKHDIYKYVKEIVLKLGIKLPKKTAKDYILAFAPKLGVSEGILREALKISESLPQGINPIVGAGASLYLASQKNGHKLRQFEIAEVLGITDVGLRLAIKRMNENKIMNGRLLRAEEFER